MDGGQQRLTATRLQEMLVAEGLEVGVTMVKEAVAEWKRRRREVYVPLQYAPGELAEVDFFEVHVDVAGRRQKAFLFVMRLMASGTDFVARSTTAKIRSAFSTAKWIRIQAAPSRRPSRSGSGSRSRYPRWPQAPHRWLRG